VPQGLYPQGRNLAPPSTERAIAASGRVRSPDPVGVKTRNELPEVFARADAYRAGFTRHQVTYRLRTGAWLALRRGAFCLRDTYDAASDGRRRELHAAAARMACPALELVDSHITAASRLSLPMPLGDLPRATLTDGCIQHTPRVDSDVVIQVATLWPGDVARGSNGPLTSPARTAADCLRHYPAQTSIPIADAAIQRGLTTRAAIAETLGRQSTWPYAARASASLPLVDGRRESWLESVSAVRLWIVGVELAEAQVAVFDESGTFIARVDALWRTDLTVGEADGRSKYSLAEWPDLANAEPRDLAEARRDAVRRVVRLEKEREDALRDAGLEVVRWSTAEILGDAPGVARRIERAQARARGARFTGRFLSRGAA
jgi:hypothetical protein